MCPDRHHPRDRGASSRIRTSSRDARECRALGGRRRCACSATLLRRPRASRSDRDRAGSNRSHLLRCEGCPDPRCAGASAHRASGCSEGSRALRRASRNATDRSGTVRIGRIQEAFRGADRQSRDAAPVTGGGRCAQRRRQAHEQRGGSRALCRRRSGGGLETEEGVRRRPSPPDFHGTDGTRATDVAK